MGAGQSARRLTINNEDDIDVIKVSNSIVQRLTQKANEANIKSTNELESPNLAQPLGNKNIPSPPPESRSTPVSSGYPTYYYPQMTITALEMQQQKEQELLKQDQYWKKRLENLEKNHVKINQIINEEYKKAVEELYVDRDKKNVNIHNTVQPCLGSIDKVLKCYQEYPKEILKCSNLVEEFSNCVDERRATVIAARC
ncbi:coiled-coil-helix-coiled-coil-helix domain containing 3 [Nomia melanderi]|uniref:coiled-coil-helix-coiled-coil-helix domain containing 3 n=1 Tax=Nomia melanderi TaxID=2448451 RepID=UPI0013046FAF|nr:MICOS complex subunit MIC25 [Nomia melanderi]XP_031838151.1 MICOS complex subunit MIC25 [Nomia melanderi]XP_031838152.1 MICOS complex subunit MIC25 [Nomia melanderi]